MDGNGEADTMLPMNLARPLSRCVPLAHYFALSLLGMMFTAVAAFTLMLMLNAGEWRWCLPLALALIWPVGCLFLLRDFPRMQQYGALALVFALTGAAIALTGYGTDLSYDGLAYHSDAIWSLLRGDNPYYGGLTSNGESYTLWTRHYPKAAWYFAAIIIHAIGYFQAGKLHNFLLIGAVFFYIFAWGRQRALPTYTCFLLALAAAFGPVQMTQIWTFYVDCALGSLFTLLIFSGLSLLAAPRKTDAVVFCMAGVLIVDLKFTGLIYALIIAALGGVALLYRWRAQKDPEAFERCRTWILCNAVIFTLGIFVIGFDPYVTNTLNEGHPMYPLAGAHKIDVVSHLMPSAFQDEPGIESLIQSVFCKGVFTSVSEVAPVWKWPFTFTREEMQQLQEPDTKIEGWGVLYSGLLVTGFLLYVLAKGWRNTEATLAVVITLATVLVNPHAWWARFAAQVALLPLFLTLPALQSKKWAVGGNALLVLSLVNSVLILVPNTKHYHDTGNQAIEEASHILSACGPGFYDVYKKTPFHYEQFLESRGIIRQEHIGAKEPPQGGFQFRELYLYPKDCRRADSPPSP